MLQGAVTVDADFGRKLLLLQMFLVLPVLTVGAGEYPWQAAVLKKDEYDNVYVCGAALIGQ